MRNSISSTGHNRIIPRLLGTMGINIIVIIIASDDKTSRSFNDDLFDLLPFRSIE